jgi:short-subunit dehydrogenase
MHVAVTGASAGIGEAIAREFGKHGASVSLVARRKERLDAIAKEMSGVKTATFGVDLSNPEGATAWIAEAEAALGPIDVLVNNAGVQVIEAAESANIEKGEEMLRLNVFTPLRLTIAVLPGMIARGRGTIVDISSMAALAPVPGMFFYNAAKGALANASEGLRGELRGTGVHVLTVYPGPVDTDMGRKGYASYEQTWSSKLSPQGNSEDLARMVRRGVERRTARIIYPRFYVTALWFPRLSRWIASRFAPPIKRLST